ncbi:MAG: ABC transporter substrate-binding protein [Wenzhouxiangellaceae bacterium]|nr:ABC transporter substrate-binding protein [Wenzhouxiangellaceae bacterium]
MNIFGSLKSLLVTLVLVQCVHAQSENESGPGPEQVVERLEQTLINIMRSPDDFEGRFETIEPVIKQSMAIERMGRYLFGRDWRSIEDSDRERFTETFLDLSAATYAGQFDEYNGEQFEAVETQRQSEDRALVRRRLITGSGKKIAFDYLMTRSDTGWKIVTIITDGVSDLAIKRTQYRRILADNGFDAVIARIRESIESQRSD